TITVQSWAKGNNLVPDLGLDQAVGNIGTIGATPAGSVTAWPSDVTFGTGAFSSTGVGTFDNGPGDTFSLFAQVSINFAGAGSVSFDENQKAVPVPALFAPAGRGGGGLWVAPPREEAAPHAVIFSTTS